MKSIPHQLTEHLYFQLFQLLSDAAGNRTNVLIQIGVLFTDSIRVGTWKSWHRSVAPQRSLFPHLSQNGANQGLLLSAPICHFSTRTVQLTHSFFPFYDPNYVVHLFIPTSLLHTGQLDEADREEVAASASCLSKSATYLRAFLNVLPAYGKTANG